MKKILLNLFAFSSSKFRRLLQPQSIVTSVSIFVIFTLVVDFSENKNQRISNSKSKQLLNWIPSINDSSNDANDRIFFHETSGRMELSFKESCVVESAALHNPQRPVQIFFQPQQQHEPSAVTIDQSSAWFQVLSQYENVQVIVIDDEELYFKDSPLEDWYKKGQWRDSPYRLQHMSDYIRMVSLKKQGGMYLDLDVLTLKPYNGRLFRNFVICGSAQMKLFTNAVLHLERTHPLIDLMMNQQAQEYLPDEFTFHGPQALTSAVLQLCNNQTAVECARKIRILRYHNFSPIGSAFCQVLFQRRSNINTSNDEQRLQSEFLEKVKRSHGLHFYNSLTRNDSVDLTPNSTQMFARLAAQNCPLTFNFAHQLI